MSPTEIIDCARALELVDRQLDGEIDEAGLVALESHLAGCPSCRAEVQLARRLQVGLRRLGPQECPDSVVASLMTRLPISDTALGRDQSPQSDGRSGTQSAGAVVSFPTPDASSSQARVQAARSVGLALAATVLLTLAVSLWVAMSAPLGERPGELQPAVNGVDVSASDLEQAEREARLAFAYLGAITKRATQTLRNDVLSPPAPAGHGSSAPGMDNEVQQR